MFSSHVFENTCSKWDSFTLMGNSCWYVTWCWLGLVDMCSPTNVTTVSCADHVCLAMFTDSSHESDTSVEELRLARSDPGLPRHCFSNPLPTWVIGFIPNGKMCMWGCPLLGGLFLVATTCPHGIVCAGVQCCLQDVGYSHPLTLLRCAGKPVAWLWAFPHSSAGHHNTTKQSSYFSTWLFPHFK